MKIEFKSINDILYLEDSEKANLGFGGFATVKLVAHVNFPDFKFALKKLKKATESEN